MIYSKKIEIFLMIAFPLLILFSYLGRGIYNSFLFLVFTATIFLIVKNKKTKYLFNDFNKYFIIFVLSTIPSFVYAIDPYFSYSKFVTFFLTSFAIILCAQYLFHKSYRAKENLIVALSILFYTSVIMEIITITGMYFHFDPIIFLKTGSIVPMYGSYHLREVFTAAILPLGLFYYYIKPHKIKLLFIIIAFIGILASTSRTAMLAVLFSVPLFIIIKNRGKIFTKEILLFIVILVLALSTSFVLNEKIQKRVESFATTFTTKGDMMSGRFTVYSESFRHFNDAPITGKGIKSGIVLNKQKDFRNKHPHNIWLELLMDVGIIGTIGFILFIVFLLSYLYKLRKKISIIHNATIWSTLLTIFLSSLASWSIWIGNHIGPMLIILMIIFYLDKIELEKNI